MTRLRDPFREALLAVRQAAAIGRYPPGGPIVIADEARDMGMSTTPVREALCWLGGEGVVERGGAGGFFAPRLDATVLAQRYGFRQMCLIEVSGRSVTPVPEAVIAQTEGAQRVLAAWVWRMRSLGDVALMEAFMRVQAHLSRFSAAEARLFSDLDAEAEALLAVEGDDAIAALIAYHRRRIEAATLLVLDAEADAAPDGGA